MKTAVGHLNYFLDCHHLRIDFAASLILAIVNLDSQSQILDFLGSDHLVVDYPAVDQNFHLHRLVVALAAVAAQVKLLILAYYVSHLGYPALRLTLVHRLQWHFPAPP